MGTRDHDSDLFCETQWSSPPLFSPSWLIQWSMGRGSPVGLRVVFHYSPGKRQWRNSWLVCFFLLLYLSLYDFYSVKIQPRVCSLSLSWTVVEYHSQSYWARREGLIWPCFHRVTSLRFTEWIMWEGVLYKLIFTEWGHCVSENVCCAPFSDWWNDRWRQCGRLCQRRLDHVNII